MVNSLRGLSIWQIQEGLTQRLPSVLLTSNISPILSCRWKPGLEENEPDITSAVLTKIDIVLSMPWSECCRLYLNEGCGRAHCKHGRKASAWTQPLNMVWNWQPLSTGEAASPQVNLNREDSSVPLKVRLAQGQVDWRDGEVSAHIIHSYIPTSETLWTAETKPPSAQQVQEKPLKKPAGKASWERYRR